MAFFPHNPHQLPPDCTLSFLRERTTPAALYQTSAGLKQNPLPVTLGTSGSTILSNERAAKKSRNRSMKSIKPQTNCSLRGLQSCLRPVPQQKNSNFRHLVCQLVCQHLTSTPPTATLCSNGSRLQQCQPSLGASTNTQQPHNQLLKRVASLLYATTPKTRSAAR